MKFIMFDSNYCRPRIRVSYFRNSHCTPTKNLRRQMGRGGRFRGRWRRARPPSWHGNGRWQRREFSNFTVWFVDFLCKYCCPQKREKDAFRRITFVNLQKPPLLYLFILFKSTENLFLLSRHLCKQAAHIVHLDLSEH